MAGTTRLELATSAVTGQRDLVLQQLIRLRGLPKFAEVAQDTPKCGLGCGLDNDHWKQRLSAPPCRFKGAPLISSTEKNVEDICAAARLAIVD